MKELLDAGIAITDGKIKKKDLETAIAVLTSVAKDLSTLSQPIQVYKDQVQVKPYKAEFRIKVELDRTEMNKYLDDLSKKDYTPEEIDSVKQDIQEEIHLAAHQSVHIRKNGVVSLHYEINRPYRQFIKVTLVDMNGNQIEGVHDIADWRYTDGEIDILEETYYDR